MSILEVTLGPMALGIFLNTYLYGIVTYQYSAYFNTKFKDPLWIKLTVLALFSLDTFHSASLIYMAWYYLVKSFGNFLALMDPVWPYPSTIFITVATALLTHVFLIYRTVRLTNRFVYIPLLLLSFGSFGTGMGCGVRAYLWVKREADMVMINSLMISWLSLELAVDVLISGTLIWALARSRTGFQRSDTVINRLMRTSVQTGLFSGIFSMLALTFFLARPETQFFALFGLPIARLYTNTLMDTLLCREGLRGILNQTDVSLSSFHTSGGSLQLHIRKDIRSDIDFNPSSNSMSPVSPKKSMANDQTMHFRPEAATA
ncbi:unnamed protein product [Cyclocybe aegerita]|uniref:DUF6534 domain-containing protein n=1 Tax=Cyclocybe aegerita TaxID=1973307 RepID=A0A8S0XG82_CYCAE|nr:unnamed protein product [Cyclocybe aegerita]